MARNKPTVTDLLKTAISNTQFFKDTNNNLHAIITVNGDKSIVDIPSSNLEKKLRKLFLFTYQMPIDTFDINNVISNLEAWADDNIIEIPYFSRVGMINNTIYYNLGNKENEMVVISKDGANIVDNSNLNICFKPTKEQVSPNLDTKPDQLLSLLKSLFRVTDEQQLLLLVVYIVSCFIYDINHPVLVIYGSHGSSKSTTVDSIGKIIDPNSSNRLTLGTDRRNLISTLSNRYFSAFDNLQILKQWQSNKFCNVSTGGAELVRILYTTDTTKELNLKGCVCLNGINISAIYGDLLDRSILIELTRIPDEEYITEQEYNKKLNSSLPNILGSIFNTLSEAMKLFEQTTYSPKTRMADFAKWGYCIAEIITKDGGKKFEKSYQANKQIAKDETKIPLVLDCICKLMKNSSKWQGTMTELREELQPIARQKGYKPQEFPVTANSLSRHIGYVKDNFSKYGIEFSQKNGGTRKVTITNKNYENNFKLKMGDICGMGDIF